MYLGKFFIFIFNNIIVIDLFFWGTTDLSVQKVLFSLCMQTAKKSAHVYLQTCDCFSFIAKIYFRPKHASIHVWLRAQIFYDEIRKRGQVYERLEHIVLIYDVINGTTNERDFEQLFQIVLFHYFQILSPTKHNKYTSSQMGY